jgi:hypothetical protein
MSLSDLEISKRDSTVNNGADLCNKYLWALHLANQLLRMQCVGRYRLCGFQSFVLQMISMEATGDAL